MPAGRVSINKEDMQSLVTNLNHEAVLMELTANALQKKIETYKEFWGGDSVDAFVQMMQRMRNDFTKALDALRAIAKYVGDVAFSVSDLDQSMAAKFRSV